jgi:hypothetical protein
VVVSVVVVVDELVIIEGGVISLGAEEVSSVVMYFVRQ